MIVARIRGRLGNQLFQYAMARSLAVQKGTELRLDLTHFRFENYQCRLGAFRTTWKEATLADIGAVVLESHAFRAAARGVGVDPCPIEQRAARSIPRLSGRPYIREEPKLIGFDEKAAERVSAVGKEAYIDGFWQSERWFVPHKNQILEEIALREEPPPEFREWEDRLSGNDVVSVHVRRGDYQAHEATKSVYGVCGEGYYRQAADEVARRIGAPRFFVFSDDPAWAERELDLGRPFEVVRTKGLAEYHELHLMAKCAHNVISNSTFGWWGAYLNRNPSKVVVSPSRWTKPEAGLRESGLIPSSWIAIPT